MGLRRRVVLVGLLLLGAASPASAQSLADAAATSTVVEAELAQDPEPPRTRPRILVPLYVMQFTLNGLDVHSTLRALDAGYREANPLFDDGDAKKMIGAKIASSAVSVFVAEKLWRKNRVAAVLMMVGVNSGLAAVVANNYRLADSRARR